MALITVVINRRSNIRNKIRERYNELFQGWRRENPNSREYTIAKLNANIRNVLSINGQSFKEQEFRPSTIKEWSGRKVLPFAHWFFLVRFQADNKGRVYAIVEDACYEGDYHNDNMNTQPYGESYLRLKQVITESIRRFRPNRQQTIRLTEAQFKRILTECITKIIDEIA